jgi:lipopolysaccharide export system permease protein
LQANWPKNYRAAKRPLITVLDKMIAVDLTKTLLSVWIVIVVIIVSQKFIKILEKAVEGHISNDTILTVLGLKTVVVGIGLLPAATFMALLMVLGRLYKDHEMSAIASAGGGAGTLYRAISLFALPLIIITSCLSLFVSPWAESKMQSIMNVDEQSSDIRGIAAGKFSEYSSGDLVFYVETISSDNRMQSVFLQNRKKKKLSIITSKNSRFEDLPGGRYMIFENGQHIQGHPGELDYIIEEFKEYAVKIEEKAASNSLNAKATQSRQLWQSNLPKDVAELQNRLSLPLTIALFAFLAVPLAKVAPRGGIYGSMMLGFLIYFSHGNFLGIMQSWVVKGSIPVWPGVYWVNFALFLVGLLLLANWLGFHWVVESFKKRTLK